MGNLLTFLEETETKTDIIFPHLGIALRKVGSYVTVFGIKIMFYGIVIGLAMIIGYLMAEHMAKRTGQNPEPYLDFTIIAVIVSVFCARLYYVIFNWSQYKDNFWDVFNIRAGGLAIYGGVIGGILTAVVFTKIRKLPRYQFLDTAILGLLTGQIIGRWGNFFNRECFGTYTDGPFAMLVDTRDVSPYFNPATSQKMVENVYAGKTRALERILEIRNNAVARDGATYVSVHPTFLYESLWNLVLLVFLCFRIRRKKFDGEILLLYLFGYGLGRFWIEGLRTDQLFLFNTPIAVSQLLSAILVVGSAIAYVILWRKNSEKKESAKETVKESAKKSPEE